MSHIIIIFVLILLNGILSMCEIAFISLNKIHLTNEIKKGDKKAMLVLKLLNEPDHFLSTIQIGITIIGILTGIFSGKVLAESFSVKLETWGIQKYIAYPLAQIIIIIVVTYISLILGELVPKRIGMTISLKIAKLFARPMNLLSIITLPFVWILAKSTHALFSLFGLKKAKEKITEEEIILMIEEGKLGGEIQEVEQDIVERVFLLGDLKVHTLMTHRAEILAINIHADKKQIKEILEIHLYDMYPLIDSNLDQVMGIVLLKDLILGLQKDNFNLNDIVRNPVYIYEHTSVYKALETMKRKHISQALISDEFGACIGIITLRDILGGLVGELDQYAPQSNIEKIIDEDKWMVDGQCSLYDFFSYFEKDNMHSQDNDFDTIGGLILNQLGYIPEVGDSLIWDEFKMKIVSMSGAKISKVELTKRLVETKS